jgi:hypothetical protein
MSSHAPDDKADPHHLCYTVRILAVRLVDLRLQHGPHMSRFNTNHWQARFGENAVKPLRQRSSFQPNSLEVIGGFVSTCSSASGSLAAFTSRAILPVSSTMQMLVSLTETSSPAKWSMLRFPSDA